MAGPNDEYIYWLPGTKERPIGVGIPRSPVVTAEQVEMSPSVRGAPEGERDLTDVFIEERGSQLAEQMKPDAVAARRENEAAGQAQLAEQTQAYLEGSGVAGTGPKMEQYDYQALVRDGLPPTAQGEDQNVDLPNAHWAPNSYGIAGFDVTDGERVTNRWRDDDGFIRGGIRGIRNSTSGTVKGPPVEDIAELAQIAYGLQQEGGSMEDYNSALGSYHSDENKQRAWNATMRVRQREAIEETYVEHGESMAEALQAVPEEELPEAIAYEDLINNEVWMKSARVLWRELEGDNPVVMGLEGEYFAEPEERPMLPDAELVDWAVSTMSNFNWNIPYMAYMTTRAINGDDNFKMALYNTMVMYEAMDAPSGTVGRAVGYMLADPLTYVSLGAGRFAAMAAKIPAKRLITRIAMGGAAGGAFEGGVFMTVDDSLRQTVELEAGQREERSLTQTAAMGAVGAVGGATLGAGGAVAASPPARKLYRKAGRALVENARSVRHVAPGTPLAQTGSIGNQAAGRAHARAEKARAKIAAGDAKQINDLDVAALISSSEDVVNAPVPYRETVDHVRKTLKRKATPEVGAPKYKGATLCDDDGCIELGLPTVGHWLDKVNEMLSPEEMAESMNWYAEIPQRFEDEFGAEGEKIMIAWLMSNQNVDPAQALMNAFRVREQVGSGAVGLKGGLSDELVRSFLSGNLPERGMDLKLHDFIDSALGKQWRTAGGNVPEMGAPAVVDIHTARDMGYIDAPYRNYLVERFGKEAVEAAGLSTERGFRGEGQVEFGKETWNAEKERWEASGGVSAPQYEHAADHLRGLTDELNAVGFMGGELTPMQVQAIGWTAQARRTGSEAFNAVQSIKRNTRQLSYELAPGRLTQLAVRFGERFGNLPYNEKAAVTRKVSDLATGIALSIVRPHESVRFYGPGGYMDAPAMPSTQEVVVSSKEAAEDMADVIGYLLGQESVMVSKPVALSSKWNVALDITGPELRDPAKLDAWWSRMQELEPKLKEMGFHPTQEPDGGGIRIVWATGGEKTLEKLRTEFGPIAQRAAEELGFTTTTRATKVTVTHHGNDYEASPEGGEYLARLKRRYGPGVQRTLEREHRRNVERLFDEELTKAEARGKKKAKPKRRAKAGVTQ